MASGLCAIAMVLRVTVARSARSERKLWTGRPSWVRLVAALRSAASERWALATMEARAASAALSWSSNRIGLSALAHVPFEIVGEHAQQHVGAHAVGAAMMDGPDFEIDGLEAAEGALDAGEVFIGPDGRGGVERFGLEVGAQDIDAVEHGFGVDLFGLARERQIVVGDGDGEVLGHLVVIDHGADRECDLVLAAQRPFLAANAGLNVEQLALGGVEQLAPFARALVGEQGLRQAMSRSPG